MLWVRVTNILMFDVDTFNLRIIKFLIYHINLKNNIKKNTSISIPHDCYFFFYLKECQSDSSLPDGKDEEIISYRILF